jgi:hypothetical protein
MAMTLDAVVALANQTAQKSQYAARGAMQEAEQARLRVRDKPILQPKASEEGRAEFEREAKTPAISAPQAANEIKRRMSPVDPEAQTSLLMLLPKEEQDYATLTYQILADQRNMS